MSSNLAISLVIGASIGGAVKALRGLKSELGILRNDTLSTKAKLKALGGGIVKGFGGAISTTTAIGSSILGLAQPAIAFESAMADVKKVVNFDTPQQFKEMERDILNLTRTIPMTGDEIAAIVAAGGQAGIAREHLVGYAEDAAKMGVAFDMAAGDAGTAMATMANVLGKPISEMGKLGDAINHLSDNANSKAADIVNVIARAGSDARLLGMTETQTAALSSTFLSMGKAPELAAQAIKGITASFQQLKAGDKAKELAKIGYTTKSFAAAMNKDVQGTMLDFIERIKKLPKDMQYGFAAKIFGKQYADDIMLMAQNTEEYHRQLGLLQETDENGTPTYLGSMQREFENRSATTENNLKLLKNSFSELGITIGAKLLPLINNVVNDLKPVIYGFVEWIDKNEALINNIMLVGAGLATVSVGFFALKGALSAVLLTLFGAYKGVSTFLHVGWGVLRLLPVLAVGVLDLGISFAKLFIRINLGILKGFTLIVKSALTVVGGLAKLLAGAMLKAIMGVGKAFLFVGRAMMASPIGALIAIATAAFLIYQYWEPIKAFFGRLWDWVGNKFTAAWSWIKSVWSGAGEWFSGIWQNLKGFFNSGIGNISKTILDWSPLGLFYKAFAGVMGWFGVDLPSSFSEFGSKFMTALKDGALRAFESVKNAIGGAVDWIKEKLGFATEAEVSVKNSQGVLSAASAISSSVPQFSSGGYTGDGDKFTPAGIVHKGEYVLDKATTSRLGTGYLNQLQNGKRIESQGGLVGAVSMATDIGRQTRQIAPKPIEMPTSGIGALANSAIDIGAESAVQMASMPTAKPKSGLADMAMATADFGKAVIEVVPQSKGLLGDAAQGAVGLGKSVASIFKFPESKAEQPKSAAHAKKPLSKGLNAPNKLKNQRQSLKEAVIERQQAEQQQRMSGGNGSGDITVHFSPTIHVGGGQGGNIVQDVKAALKECQYELEKLMQDIIDQRLRKSYTGRAF